jgi:hypothetical protein
MSLRAARDSMSWSERTRRCRRHWRDPTTHPTAARLPRARGSERSGPTTHRQPRGLSASLSQATGRRTQQRTQLPSQQQTIRCPAEPATRLRSEAPGAACNSGSLDRPKRQGGRGADRPETDGTPGKSRLRRKSPPQRSQQRTPHRSQPCIALPNTAQSVARPKAPALRLPQAEPSKKVPAGLSRPKVQGGKGGARRSKTSHPGQGSQHSTAGR